MCDSGEIICLAIETDRSPPRYTMYYEVLVWGVLRTSNKLGGWGISVNGADSHTSTILSSRTTLERGLLGLLGGVSQESDKVI